MEIVLPCLFLIALIGLAATAYFYVQYHRLSVQYNQLKDRYDHVLLEIDQRAMKIYNERIAQVKQEIEQQAYRRAELWIKEQEKQIREDAVRRSRSVMWGRTTERILPILENPSDIICYLGQPVDFLVFKGLNGAEGDPVEISLIEVKTGKSTENPHQRRLKKAIQNKNAWLRWRTVWIDIDFEPEIINENESIWRIRLKERIEKPE